MKEDKQTKSLKVCDNQINTTKIEHLAEGFLATTFGLVVGGSQEYGYS